MSGCRALLCKQRTITTTQPLPSQPPDHHDSLLQLFTVTLFSIVLDYCPEAVGQQCIQRSSICPGPSRSSFVLACRHPLTSPAIRFLDSNSSSCHADAATSLDTALLRRRHSLRPGTLPSPTAQSAPSRSFRCSALPRSSPPPWHNSTSPRTYWRRSPAQHLDMANSSAESPRP